MAVPDFQSLMRPVLDQYADGRERMAKDVREAVAKALHLAGGDIHELAPRGRQTRFANRLAWAHSYLRQAGLLESPRRGVYRLTARAVELLPSLPSRVDIKYLERFDEFREFRLRGGEPGELGTEDTTTAATSTVALTPAPHNQLFFTRAAVHRASIGAKNRCLWGLQISASRRTVSGN